MEERSIGDYELDILQPRSALCRKWSEAERVLKAGIKRVHPVCMSIEDTEFYGPLL